MILDIQNLLSDNQAITGDDVSDNILYLGPTTKPVGGKTVLGRDLGKGVPVPLTIVVTKDFDKLTSLTISIEVDSTDSFSSPKTLTSVTIPAASLKAGYRVGIDYIPTGADELYLRLNYDVTGTNPDNGAITAGISMGNQTNLH